MRWPAAILALAFAGVAASRASGAPQLSSAGDILTPAQIMARYGKALANVRSPKAVAFDYSVAQLGLRNMEQTHHVYRSTLRERDETRIVDGYVLPRPTIRLIANRIYRYDLRAVAPTKNAYTFAYSGSQLDGDDITYTFRTTPAGTRSFAVDEIVIDGKTFLPKTIHFKIASGRAHGSGVLLYARFESYWVIADAHVSAHLANGTLATEHIKWSNYQFPPSLPPSTFMPPRTILAPIPDVTASPTPAPDPGAP